MATMATYTYRGTAYKQSQHRDAPWIVSFVAPAEELLLWAGIPRKSDQKLVGFQRMDDEVRVTRAKNFFTTQNNQSPTALIVGIHRVEKESERTVRLEIEKPEQNDDSATAKNQASAPAIFPCRLIVNYDPALPLELAVERVRRQIRLRLEASPLETDVDPASEMEYAEEQEESGVDNDEQTDDDEIEMGRSLLHQLLTRLDDPVFCEQNAEDIRDLARPATIIDGQHRVKGAQRCERKIPFAVCALFDCSWPEQVFQFTVVNYTAKGIPDQFITANAALSLTKLELNKLSTRLVQANVKVIEYELMKVVNFEPESPFYEKVNLSEKKDSTRIGYKTMVRLARGWYSGHHDVFNQLLPNLYPEIKGSPAKVKSARVTKWKQSEDWGRFFIDFWRVAYEKYRDAPSHEPGFHLWDVGYSNLIIAVVLIELQEAYFVHLNQQDEEFFLVREGIPIDALRMKLRKRAEKFFEYFPAEFFSMNWVLKSLSIGPGRVALSQTIEQLVSKKGKFQYANCSLITGNAGGARS